MNQLLHTVSEFIYRFLEQDFLLDFFIKSTAVILLAFLINRKLKSFSASVKHWIWNLAFAIILVLPVTSSNLQIWDLGLYSQEIISITETASEPGQITDQGVFTESVSINKNSGKTNSEPAGASLMEWITFAWLLGMMILIFLMLFEIFWLTIIKLKHKTVNDPAWDFILEESRKKIGLRKKVRLYRSNKLGVPMTFGFVKPVIILPEHAAAWDHDKIKMVLIHELAHIKKGDYLINLFVNFATIIAWFNPLVWIGSYYQRVQREKACDDLVLNLKVDAARYATELLNIIKENKNKHLDLAKRQVAVTGFSGLKQRVVSILNKETDRSELSLKNMILSVIIACIMIIPLSGVNLMHKVQPEVPVVLPEEELNAFINELSSDDDKVRYNAAYSLVNVRQKEIINPLITALDNEKNNEIKKQIILALVKFGENKSFYSIASNMDNKDPVTRLAILDAFGTISCFPSFLLLEECLNDPDENVKNEAERMIRIIRKNKLRRSAIDFASVLNYSGKSRIKLYNNLDRIPGSEIINSLKNAYLIEDPEERTLLKEKLISAAENNDFGSFKEVLLNNAY